jgi:ribokinase
VAEPHPVIVVGSLHYDLMVTAGGWPGLGETIAARGWQPKLGGKGRNQAVAARRAGAPTTMIGRLGDDQFGHELAADLVRRGIDTRHLVTGTERTGISVAITEPGGDYRAFIVSSANLELGAGDLPRDWPAGAVLVLQNEVPAACNLAAGQAASAAGARVILNAAPFRPLAPELLATLDILVVNAVEAAQLAGISEPITLDAALVAAQALAGQVQAVIVTAGGAGCAYADARQAFALPAEPVRVISSHGAGDSFVGTLAAALAGGQPAEAAMQAASAAAAQLISTVDDGR